MPRANEIGYGIVHATNARLRAWGRVCDLSSGRLGAGITRARRFRAWMRIERAGVLSAYARGKPKAEEMIGPTSPPP